MTIFGIEDNFKKTSFFFPLWPKNSKIFNPPIFYTFLCTIYFTKMLIRRSDVTLRFLLFEKHTKNISDYLFWSSIALAQTIFSANLYFWTWVLYFIVWSLVIKPKTTQTSPACSNFSWRFCWLILIIPLISLNSLFQEPSISHTFSRKRVFVPVIVDDFFESASFIFEFLFCLFLSL